MKQRILVIEDNDQNIYMITYLLEHAGFEVEQARDGRAGINAALGCPPDLIVLDIQLPGLDGYEVARTLRAMPGLRDVPIIAVTSHAMPGDRELTLQAGCTGYLEKPIDPDSFVDSITGFLPREGGES